MDSVEKAGQFVQERKALIAKLAVEYDEACEQNLEFLISQFPKADFNMDTINAVMDKCAAFDAKWTQVSLDNKVFAGAIPLSMSTSRCLWQVYRGMTF